MQVAWEGNAVEEKELPLLEEAIGKIWAKARSLGLDPFPTHFEIVPPTILYEFGAYLLPGRFSHWSHGKAFYTMKTQYDYGLSKIYELVINTDPSYAFLLDTNTLLQNKFVVAHVFGHTDFFKHNAWFADTNRQMLESVDQSAQRIRRYGMEEGSLEVERFLDAVLSIADHVDPIRRRQAPAVQRERQAPEHPYGDLYPYVAHGTLATGRPLKGKKQPLSARQVPPEPEKDLLLFLAEHAELEEWQRDIIHVVREETLHLASGDDTASEEDAPQDGREPLRHVGKAEVVGMEAIYKRAFTGVVNQPCPVAEGNVAVAFTDRCFVCLPNDAGLPEPLLTDGGKKPFFRLFQHGDHQDRRVWMRCPQRAVKRQIDLSQPFYRGNVHVEIQDEAGGVNLRQESGHLRLAQAVSGVALIDHVQVELAPQHWDVPVAGPGGASALRDGTAIEDDRLRECKGRWRAEGGACTQANLQADQAVVGRQVEGKFPLLRRKVFEKDGLIGALRGAGHGGGPVHLRAGLTYIEINAAVACGRHIPHLHHASVGHPDGERGGVAPEADAGARRHLRQAPDIRPHLLPCPKRQADELALVLLPPREPRDVKGRVGCVVPLHERDLHKVGGIGVF